MRGKRRLGEVRQQEEEERGRGSGNERGGRGRRGETGGSGRGRKEEAGHWAYQPSLTLPKESESSVKGINPASQEGESR